MKASARIALDALLCALLMARWFAIWGYNFGWSDNAIHVSFITAASDETLFPGDPLIEAARHHPELLRSLLAPLADAVALEWIFLALQLVSLAAMLCGVRALTLAAGADPGARLQAWLGALMASNALDTLAGIKTFEWFFFHRNLVIGPLLWALALGLRGRFVPAFLVAGAIFNLHPTSGAHGAILLFSGALLQAGRWRDIGLGALAFVAAALPLVWVIASQGAAAGVDYPAPDAWWQLNRLQVYFHHFPLDWTYEDHWQHLLAPLALATASALALRSRAVLGYVLGTVVTCAVGVVGVELLRHPIFVQLHIFQITRFLPFLGFGCGAAWALRAWRRERLAGVTVMAALLLMALGQAAWITIAVTALAVVIELRGRRAEARRIARDSVTERRAHRAPAWLTPALLVLMTVAQLVKFDGAALWGRWSIQTTLAQLPDHDVMVWSRKHLPPDAVVAIPPYFWSPLTSFRYVARRAIVATYKDGGEVSFSEEYAREWRARIEALCRCEPFRDLGRDASLYDEWVRRRRLILDGYRTADAARFRALRERHGATHAVVEKRAIDDDDTGVWSADAGAPVTQPSLPVVYDGPRFRVYRIE
jgi:hypothetical protein